MKLKELKAIDLKKDQKYDFLLPIGATEQHGPFIPFGTDTYIADYLVEQVSKEFPEIIILPTLEYSDSQEHRGFYGTIWLTEATLISVLFDICNSLKDRARNIYLYSFHANDVVINKFIQDHSFPNVKICPITESIDQDLDQMEAMISGPVDDHAGNTEISNMLVIDKNLVTEPDENYPKKIVDNPFETDNLFEKCPVGFADNHPKWIIDETMGKKVLDIYVARMIKQINDINN